MSKANEERARELIGRYSPCPPPSPAVDYSSWRVYTFHPALVAAFAAVAREGKAEGRVEGLREAADISENAIITEECGQAQIARLIRAAAALSRPAPKEEVCK